MKSLLHRIAALVSVFSLLAAPALAHGNGNNGNRWRWNRYNHVRSIDLALQSIDAQFEQGELFVAYEIDPQSLRFANQSGIFPVLQVEVGGTVFQTRLETCEGVAVFDLGHRAEPREAVISVTGANGRYRIDSVSLGGRTSARVTIPVEICHDRHDDRDRDRDRDGHGNGQGNHGGGQQPQARWSFQPAVIQACGNAFDGQQNELACLQTVDGFAFNPVNTINTCERTMDGDANEMACLQTAVRSSFDRSQQLNACELAMDGDANELACFAKATTARFDPMQTIHACEAAFDGDGNELACMEATFRFSFSPVPVIQSCEMSMDGDSAELACLARY